MQTTHFLIDSQMAFSCRFRLVVFLQQSLWAQHRLIPSSPSMDTMYSVFLSARRYLKWVHKSYIHTCTSTSTGASTGTHKYTSTSTSTCTNTCTHKYKYKHKYACIHVHIHTKVHVRTRYTSIFSQCTDQPIQTNKKNSLSNKFSKRWMLLCVVHYLSK